MDAMVQARTKDMTFLSKLPTSGEMVDCIESGDFFRSTDPHISASAGSFSSIPSAQYIRDTIPQAFCGLILGLYAR